MIEKKQGIVKWFQKEKGFGFIQCEGHDYFVHFSGIIAEGYKTLPDGAQVSFTAIDGVKGKQAHEVEIIQRA